jgi:hypothetical protein
MAKVKIKIVTKPIQIKGIIRYHDQRASAEVQKWFSEADGLDSNHIQFIEGPSGIVFLALLNLLFLLVCPTFKNPHTLHAY